MTEDQKIQADSKIVSVQEAAIDFGAIHEEEKSSSDDDLLSENSNEEEIFKKTMAVSK